MTYYTDIIARYYDALCTPATEQELSFYAEHIMQTPAPALELGCGTGRVMLPLVQRGLCIQGVDSSAAMLKRCEDKAGTLGLSLRLHQQPIELLQLPTLYGCIYSPLGSFQQIADRQQAVQALERCYAQLCSGGRLVLYAYLPWLYAPEFGVWHAREPVSLPDDETLHFFEKTVHEPQEQLLFSQHQYKLYKAGKLQHQHESEQVTRWYSRYELQDLLCAVGFEQVRCQAGYDDTGPFDQMLFVASKT